MVEGWSEHAGDRHHGAHGEAVSRSLQVRVEDLLDFSQNINPFGPPPEALEAARRALYEESVRYPDLKYTKLRGALAQYLDVAPENIVPTNGGAEALFLAAGAAGAGGALVLEPTFSEYAAAARASGMEVVRRVVRRPEDGFRFDHAAVEDLGGISVVFLCNPNNPTGDSLDYGEVLEVADRVREAGAILVVDEAFADFMPGISVAAMVERRALGRAVFHQVLRDTGPAARLPRLRRSGARPEATTFVAGQRRRRRRRHRRRQGQQLRRSVGCRGRPSARRTLRRSGRSRTACSLSPARRTFFSCRGPEGLAGRLARRGVLVRGCGPFMGLGPGYFRVAVRGEAENARLISALREEL